MKKRNKPTIPLITDRKITRKMAAVLLGLFVALCFALSTLSFCSCQSTAIINDDGSNIDCNIEWAEDEVSMAIEERGGMAS